MPLMWMMIYSLFLMTIRCLYPKMLADYRRTFQNYGLANSITNLGKEEKKRLDLFLTQRILFAEQKSI